MSDFESVLADASQLPVVDRVQLIEALWDTVPDDALPPMSDEWISEIKRRSAEFDAGVVKAVPWEQIRAEAFHRAGLTVPDVAR
jgi:putative addiction module component (TIGR02574 family)